MSAALDTALACAGRGWPVFPCKPADKKPFTDHGFKDAATDEGTIRRWWGEYPHALVGVDCGRAGLVVADVDVSGGKPGRRSWANLVAELGTDLEDTAATRTRSGGWHRYYRANGHHVKCSEGALAPAIDIRAEGGYVIAWEAWVDGHGLERLSDLPAALAAKLAGLAKKREGPATPVATVIRAGEGRHAALVSLAGMMRNRGMESDEIAPSLLAFNKRRLEPPYPEDEVHKVAASMANYEPGHPLDKLVPVAPQQAATGDLASDPIGGLIDWPPFWATDQDESEWLYDGVLALGRGHALYAPGKEGKSLFMLWLAAQLATGPEPIVAVYLDYEMSEADVRERLEDMGYGPETDLSRFHYYLWPRLAPLDTTEGGQALVRQLEAYQTERADHQLAVFFDTMGRAVTGKESEADTVRAFYARTGIELKRRGFTWMRADHAGKDLTKGQRGSSAKSDDVDVVWKLSRTNSGVCLSRDAARMGWVPARVTFSLQEAPLRYVRLVGDWPEHTGEVANMLTRFDVPLDATYPTAAAALKARNEGRGKGLVLAALRFRRDRNQ